MITAGTVFGLELAAAALVCHESSNKSSMKTLYVLLLTRYTISALTFLSYFVGSLIALNISSPRLWQLTQNWG